MEDALSSGLVPEVRDQDAKTQSVTRRRGRARGYSTNHLPAHIQQQLKDFEATSLLGSLTDAALYFLSIVACAAAVYHIWRVDLLLGIVAYLFSLIFLARQQRGLELMVHDASHFSWNRENRKLNDILSDVVVAFATMGTTAGYRKSHMIHHGTYAGEHDPCKRRFAEMGLGHVDLSTKWNIFKAVLRWLPQYNGAYYAEIGSKSWGTLLSWAAWHTFVLILPVAYFLGLAQSFVIWFLFWFVPMFVSLPVLRSIAEAEEHDYERGETEFDSTFTNDGWIHHLLWHPWNDAYHQIHHLFPNISQRRHRQVHKLLMAHDPKYQSSPMRKKTLEMLTKGR